MERQRLLTKTDWAITDGVVKDLIHGSWAIFDPVFGTERVTAITFYNLPNGVRCAHMQLGDSGPDMPGRFIVRAEHEPILMVEQEVEE